MVSAIETIYGTVNNVISQIVFKDNDHINDLSDFAVAEFLNNSLISTIAKGVFSLADNETVARIFNILNVKMTKDYIVKQLNYYGYAELAHILASLLIFLGLQHRRMQTETIFRFQVMSLVSYGMFHPNMIQLLIILISLLQMFGILPVLIRILTTSVLQEKLSKRLSM